jgi:hypothetical protein
MRRSILGAALLLLTALVSAQGHDWKFVGCDDTDPRQPCFFYQPSEIKKLPGGDIQVWTKSLSKQQMKSAGAANDASLHPISRMLFEIDCEQAEFRTLSVITDEGAPMPSPSPWFHAPPGSMTHSLVTLTCNQ